MRYLFLGALLLISEAQSINFFSPKQDIEMGKVAAAEAETQVTLVHNVQINQYIRSLALRLLPSSTLHQVHYEFHIVNSNEIDSLGFPNGSIYLYRGLLKLAANDDEVAAIMAHEIGHVASRHATSQLSRQLLVQAPISISAGLPTMDGWKEQLNKLGVVFGVNAQFLHYSPEQESEAAGVAARLLTAAHFNPLATAAVFQKVSEAGENAPVPIFLYNHPFPLSAISDSLSDSISEPRHIKSSPEFRAFRAALLKLPRPAEPAVTTPDEELPNVFTHEYYQLNYPDGWLVRRLPPNGAIIAPADGVRTSTTAGDDVMQGVMVDMFELPAGEKPLTLAQATNRLIVTLRQRNQTLRAVPGAQTPTLIHDEPGLRTVLFEKSAVTGSNELVWVVTRMYYQNLFYLVFVAPEEEFSSHEAVFEQIIRSVQIR